MNMLKLTNLKFTKDHLNFMLYFINALFIQKIPIHFIQLRSQQLELAQQELAVLKAKQSQLVKRAKSHASKVLYGCLAMAMTQLTGMGYLIFVHLSWEDMEPVTYMVSAFYAMIGALYYVIYKGDFEMASAYDLFQKRKYDGLVKKENFDDEKIEFLETYINELQEQLGILQTEENQQREKSQGDSKIPKPHEI